MIMSKREMEDLIEDLKEPKEKPPKKDDKEKPPKKGNKK